MPWHPLLYFRTVKMQNTDHQPNGMPITARTDQTKNSSLTTDQMEQWPQTTDKTKQQLQTKGQERWQKCRKNNLLIFICLYALPIQCSVWHVFFFFWGGADVKLGCRSKEIFRSHAAARKILQGLKGSGGCSPQKCLKDSVQDWLKSHLWTLVTYTDSLVAVSRVCVSHHQKHDYKNYDRLVPNFNMTYETKNVSLY